MSDGDQPLEPNIRVVSIVFDVDAATLSINHDGVSYYEALGMVMGAVDLITTDEVEDAEST